MSGQLLRACALLGVRLIHSRPGRPEGRGKIERAFRTVREQFLIELEQHPPGSVEGLNRSFVAWVESVYHRRLHSETGQPPLERFHAAGRAPAPPGEAVLRDAFLWSEKRTVSRTSTFGMHGNDYEVDAELAGQRVELVFDPLDLTEIEVRTGSRTVARAVPLKHDLRRESSPRRARRALRMTTTPAPPSLELPVPDGWPAPPDTAAYHGLPGAIVSKLAPNTEADPVAILTQLLVACGAMIGHDAFFQVEATRHHPNEFVLLVGDTAKARKGSSFDHVARLLSDAHPSFPSRVTTGLSSGEGLIWAVRDPQEQDPGAHDKRLLVVEPEFASVLKATSREISTLSPTLRSAWDGRPLALLTQTAPATATSAHISIIGHITQTELARHTTTVELANGFPRPLLDLRLPPSSSSNACSSGSKYRRIPPAS